MATQKLYPEQDHPALGDWYIRHVEAMTAEGLHAKSDIAAQLAWRDAEIERLQREVSERRVVSSTQLEAVTQLADALDEARTGLKWYQDRHPESTDGSDDEAMARIDAALLRVGR